MPNSADGNDEREQRLEAIIADVMHEAVAKFAATNNRLVVLSLFSLGKDIARGKGSSNNTLGSSSA